PETALQRGLDCRDADFAVTLDAMAVAAREQRARHEHWQIEFRPRRQFLVVEVAAHRAGDQRGDTAPRRRRRDAHYAEKRRQPQGKPPWAPAHHPRLI